jgi:hypothetical protein
MTGVNLDGIHGTPYIAHKWSHGEWDDHWISFSETIWATVNIWFFCAPSRQFFGTLPQLNFKKKAVSNTTLHDPKFWHILAVAHMAKLT